MKKTVIVALSLAALTSPVLTAVSAHASGGDAVRRSATCSDGSQVKLKAKPDDGRLEVEGEVDSNVNGQTWSWRFTRNGDGVAHGTSQTHAPSGSFEVERRIANPAGTDTIRFRATHAGEVCVVSLSI